MNRLNDRELAILHHKGCYCGGIWENEYPHAYVLSKYRENLTEDDKLFLAKMKHFISDASPDVFNNCQAPLPYSRIDINSGTELAISLRRVQEFEEIRRNKTTL